MMLDSVTMVLLLIFAVAGYLGFLEVVMPMTPKRQSKLVVSIIVLFIYLCFLALVTLIYFSFGYDAVVLYGALLLFVLVSLVLVIRGCVLNRESMNWPPTIAFIAVCAAVAYGTIFMRQGTESTSIVMEPFQRIKEAIETGDPAELNHDLMNMLMFVPLGLLLPLINRKVFHTASFAFLFGMVVSTLIESMQFLFRLGECDINDIIANTLGAVVGYLICVLLKVPERYMARRGNR